MYCIKVNVFYKIELKEKGSNVNVTVIILYCILMIPCHHLKTSSHTKVVQNNTLYEKCKHSVVLMNKLYINTTLKLTIITAVAELVSLGIFTVIAVGPARSTEHRSAMSILLTNLQVILRCFSPPTPETVCKYWTSEWGKKANKYVTMHELKPSR